MPLMLLVVAIFFLLILSLSLSLSLKLSVSSSALSISRSVDGPFSLSLLLFWGKRVVIDVFFFYLFSLSDDRKPTDRKALLSLSDIFSERVSTSPL